MRIVPRQNDPVNEDWLSDKARFQYDGLRRQRLGVPMVKGADGKLAPVSWLEALQAVAAAVKGLQGDEMKALAGVVHRPCRYVHCTCRDIYYSVALFECRQPSLWPRNRSKQYTPIAVYNCERP